MEERAGEMAQRLSIVYAFIEDLSSIPGICV